MKKQNKAMLISGNSDRVASEPSRVWIVEDNAAYRASVARVIGRLQAFAEPRSFPDCEEAVAALALGAAPDILLLDLGLPGMGGLEGISRFKSLAPQMKIVVLTSFDDHKIIFKALCAGASGYLLKSAPLAKVNEAIQEVLHGGAPLSPAVASAVLTMFASMAETKPAKVEYGLSPREKQTLEGMVRGLAVKEIAEEMQVSYHTADSYVRNIYEKLHVHSRAAAVAKAIKEQIS